MAFRSQIANRKSQIPAAWLLLGLILLAAGVIRAGGLGERSLWTDEFLSMRFSSGRDISLPFHEGFIPSPMRWTQLDRSKSPLDIWRNQVTDLHPPFYFVVLRGWRMLFGDGAAAMRSLSVFCSLASIAVLFFAVRGWFGQAAALWACAITAVALQHILYAREVRQYAMLLLWGMLALLAVQRIERRMRNGGCLMADVGCQNTSDIPHLTSDIPHPPSDIPHPTWRSTAALAVTVWLMAMTHYYFTGAALAIGVYACLFLRGRGRLAVIGALVTAGVMFAIVNGYYVIKQQQAIARVFPADRKLEDHHAIKTIARAAAQPATLLLQVPPRLRPILPLAGVVFLVPLLLIRRNRPLALWWLWACLIIGLVAFADLRRSTTSLEMPRYTVLAIPAVAVLIAVSAQWSRHTRHVVPAIVVLACLWTLPAVYAPYTSAYANRHRQMAQALSKKLQPGDAVVFAAPPNADWYPHLLYTVHLHYGDHPEQPAAFAYVPPGGAIREELMRYPRVWVVAESEVDTTAFLPGVPPDPHPEWFGDFATIRLFRPGG